MSGDDPTEIADEVRGALAMLTQLGLHRDPRVDMCAVAAVVATAKARGIDRVPFEAIIEESFLRLLRMPKSPPRDEALRTLVEWWISRE